MAVTSLNMDDETYRRLAALAEERSLTKGWIITAAVREYLDREDRRERMRIETLEALEDIEAGRVVDGERVVAWLRSWGTDHEAPPPRS